MVDSLVSVEDTNEQQQSIIFPNPNTSIVNIKNTSFNDNNIKVNIIDNSGKTIKSMNFESGTNIQFETNDISSGNYYRVVLKTMFSNLYSFRF